MKKAWKVDLEGGPHTIELNRSWIGRLTISADGQIVRQSQYNSLTMGGDYSFTLGRHALAVHVRSNGFTVNDDLSVDGISVRTGLEAKPLLPMPRWAWLFIGMCIAVPILTLGGGLPGAIGFGGAALCAAIARGQDRSVGARLAMSAGVVVACWLLVFGAIGAAIGLINRPTQTASGWTEFTSPDGSFSVRMPGTPKEQTQTADSAAGPMDVRVFMVDKGSEAYGVAYSDLPEALRGADPDVMLQGGRDGAIANVNGTLQSERAIALDGHPGLEFEATINLGSATVPKPGIFKVRIYIVNDRIYQIIVVALKERASSPDNDTFLDSFKLLGK